MGVGKKQCGLSRGNNQTSKRMKATNTLILAGAVAAAFALTTTAQAGEVLSPRAKANQITHVSSTKTDVNLVSGSYAGAATRAGTMFHSTVASGPVKDINLVSGNYLGAAVKSPQRDLRGPEFRIAPLIEKRNAGQK